MFLSQAGRRATALKRGGGEGVCVWNESQTASPSSRTLCFWGKGIHTPNLYLEMWARWDRRDKK